MKRILLLATLFVSIVRAANVPISGLPAASSVGANNLTVVVDLTDPTPANQTKKATISQLITGLPAATPSSAGIMSAADKTLIAGATSANMPSTLITRDSSGNFAANVITAATVTGLSTPVNTSDAATKAYVDSVASGLNIKNPAAAATTGSNVTLAGGAPSTLDGYTLNTNDRVLVKDQTDATQNGIYYVQTLGTGINGTWARTTDADTGAKLTTGSYVFINNGTANGSTAWVMNTPGAITIGTSLINWGQFSKIGQIQASSIIGQIVQSQIADAAINFTKFANGIEPVSIVSSLPSPSGYTGPKSVFNTSDGKLYRYSGGAFTAAVNTTDLSGTITNTQIADNSISTPKLQANSVTSTQIAAGSIVAGDIAANAVTSGTIAAGAVSTTELAAGAITSAKIAAGTIVSSNIAALTITGANIAAGTISADKINVANLSAINANLGTVTAGTITANTSLSVGTGNNAVAIDNTGMRIAGGLIDFRTSFNPQMVAVGSGSSAGWSMVFTAGSASLPPGIQAADGGNRLITFTPALIAITGTSSSLLIGSGGTQIHTCIYASTVPTWSSSATEQSFTVSTSSQAIAGFAQCSSDGGVLCRYDYDASSSSTAVFKARMIDGSSFSGSYRFSYVVLY